MKKHQFYTCLFLIFIGSCAAILEVWAGAYTTGSILLLSIADIVVGAIKEKGKQ